MNPNEIRDRVISALLQAGGPVTADELAAQSRLAGEQVRGALDGLLAERLVVEGDLARGKPAPQYCWRARWQRMAGRRAVGPKRRLQAAVGPAEIDSDRRLAIDCEPVRAFHEFIIREYRPPDDKRFCVFLQCSVRRPFSKSPSHGSMRRAIRVATGYDPRKDFESCPVHVVVLASRIGPVPYELEDVYPANVGGGGVKHFRPEQYERVRPVLAERMAEYVTAHGGRYEHMTTFTEGRYGEVMADARRLAGARFDILPDPAGAQVVRMGTSKPRTYWQRFWIQLYLRIVGWLEPPLRAEADARLRKLKVRHIAATGAEPP
jgi:hypothetical protein